MNEELSVVEEAFLMLRLEMICEKYNLSEEDLYESYTQYRKQANMLSRKLFKTKDNLKRAEFAARLASLPSKHKVSAERIAAHASGRLAAVQPKGSPERAVLTYAGKEIKPRPNQKKGFLHRLGHAISTFGD